MNHSFDLSQLAWTLAGWEPWHWRLTLKMEVEMRMMPHIAPIPARVPGSVQLALREAGLLPDWNVGQNSRACEWVENRHWQYETTLPADWCQLPGRKIIEADGLDYQGVLVVNRRAVGEFCGTFTPHEFDITSFLEAGENKLAIVFTDNPRYLGQIHFTSKIREWKARFNYVWDWTPRLVQVGVWGPLKLRVDAPQRITAMNLRTQYNARSNEGAVIVNVTADGTAAIVIRVTDQKGHLIREARHEINSSLSAAVTGLDIAEWNPNGNGAQPLYNIAVQLVDTSGKTLDERTRRVGFREIEWKPCRGAPTDAEPWICRVNGVDTFLQGINWVPIRPNFADVTEADYRQRLTLYRDLGMNILRVWGGAVLESETFYRLCDELGILVWQEFPFSSSGPDNWPPEDPQVIAEASQIAASYITRRQHHPSLLMWCGGNELQSGLDGNKAGIGKPIDRSHPMMVELARVVTWLDPDRRFVPSSSSGPRFMATEADFGKGLHHDVHGPWNRGDKWEDWTRYWDNDDSLFRSETGVPSASPADVLRELGGEKIMPASAENPIWRSLSQWWLQWDTYLADGGDAASLEKFVTWSQTRQAEALEYAARATKRRFPACGGLILWMGHDTFPCPANTSIIDFHGREKPAARAVARVFLEKPRSENQSMTKQ